jgi:uncharacterized integral membrane protein (TIGR00698 family)
MYSVLESINRGRLGKCLFFVGLSAAALGSLGPPLSLTAGIAFGLAVQHPFERQSARVSKVLLQLSVVALGFGINFGEVLKAGRDSFVYTSLEIALVIGLGLVVGRLLKVRSKAAFLITVGTAICGGSAIAAISAIINPEEEDLTASLATIFTLNSVALLIFPMIGVSLHLTQPQFGLWSALAIHDTSSVVGAASKFGSEALTIGTVVKLARALWIIPITMLTAAVNKGQTRFKIPWFILFFCLAALVQSSCPSGSFLFTKLNTLGHVGLAITLFLIGTGINPRKIKRAGPRVMLQGLILWILVATASLFIIRKGWIHI